MVANVHLMIESRLPAVEALRTAISGGWVLMVSTRRVESCSERRISLSDAVRITTFTSLRRLRSRFTVVSCRRVSQIVGDREFNAKWQGVRIHAGNSERDTEGCILPGENKIPGHVVNSRRHLANLIARLTEAYSRGETVWLTIS